MTLLSWLSVAGVCCLGAMSPGPSLAVVVQHTIRGSRRNGMVTGISHSIGVGFYALLTVSGLAAILSLQPGLHKILTVCGGVYLAWLGYKALRSHGSALQEKKGIPGRGIVDAARDGFMISLFNPKLMIFFIALFSQFVRPEMGWRASLILVVTAVVIDGGWYCIVATILSKGRFIEKLNRHAAKIDRACGVLFILLAVRVITL